MIIMAVDYGDARTGLAVCDENEILAYGAGLIDRPGFKKVAARVAERAEELGAELIVVGDPVNMDGEPGPRSAKCRDFAAEVERVSGVPTVMCDERLTSVDAHEILASNGLRPGRHRSRVDEMAARLILEDYLSLRKAEKQKNDGENNDSDPEIP